MCSSVSPSITEPRLNSIGQASLPGCSTIAWPPSWNAPSSKLVRVRMEGLKNTRAIDLPLSSSPSLLRLNNAAWVNRASRSVRLQSWVFRKCFRDIDRSFAAGFPPFPAGVGGAGARSGLNKTYTDETFQIVETKKPSAGAGFSKQAARSSGYPAKMWGSGRRARDVMPVAIRAALVSCWKSVSFMAAHLCMHPGRVQGLNGNSG